MSNSTILSSAGGPLLALGYPGQLADDQESSIMSRVNESQTGGTTSATPGMMDFGIAVARGAAAGHCKILGAGDLPIGITVRSLENGPDGNNAVGYAPSQAAGIIYQGDVFVTALEDATDGDAVYAVVSEGGKLGSIHGGGADSDRILLPNAHWVADVGQTITAGTIGRVRLTGVSNPTLST